MKRKLCNFCMVFFILIVLLCSNGILVFSTAKGISLNKKIITNQLSHSQQLVQKKNHLPEIIIEQDNTNDKILSNSEPSISIIYPEIGYFYNPRLEKKRPMPIMKIFGYAVMFDNTLKIEATTEGVDYIKFEAIKMLSGKKDILLDDNMVDGGYCNFHISTGIYIIAASGYDQNDTQVAYDSLKVIFIKNPRSGDYGIWVRTEYEDIVSTQKLNIGIAEITQMLLTQKWEHFNIDLAEQDDSLLHIRFTLDTMEVDNIGDVDVLQIWCDVETTCDTSNKYSVSLEARFPNYILNDQFESEKTIRQFDEPYFSAKVGFSSEKGEIGPTEIDTRFYFDRKHIFNPEVIGLKISPDEIGSSKVAFFGSILTSDEESDEEFWQTVTIDFDPSVELNFAVLPKLNKFILDFGTNAGIKTKVSVFTEGTIFDKLVFSTLFDPLPSSFGCTLKLKPRENAFEIEYESDSVYDVLLTIESEQLDTQASLRVNNIPKYISFNGSVDISNLKGNMNLYWDYGDRYPSILGSISIDGLTITGETEELKNKRVQALVDIDTEQRKGVIEINRSNEDEYSYLNLSLEYNDWIIKDRAQLKNKNFILSWNLATPTDSEVSLDLNPGGLLIVYNKIIVIKNAQELLNFQLWLKTNDYFHFGWEYDENDKIKNLQWSGNILKAGSIYLKVNYKNVDFEMSGDWSFEDKEGSFSIKFNKDLTITPIDIKNDKYRMKMSMAIQKDTDVYFDWKLIEGTSSNPGYVVVDTNGKEAGAQFNFYYIWDPNNSGDYKYGIDIEATGALKVENLKIKWWKESGNFHWDWSGNIYGSLNFKIYILWNYNWYGPFYIP